MMNFSSISKSQQWINISSSWKIIAHRPILTDNQMYEFSSLKGRGVCFAHFLATPFKALSGIGRLVISIAEIALTVFAVLTFNASPKCLLKIPAKIVDVAVGAMLLPIAIVANVIRGVGGAIFHPSIMIKDNLHVLTSRNQINSEVDLMRAADF